MNNFNIFDEMAFIDESVRTKWMGLINGNYYSDEDVDVLLNKKPVFIEQQVGAGQLYIILKIKKELLAQKEGLK